MQGLTLTNMYDSVPWGLWITIDLSSIALGAGAFTLSAIVYIFGIKRFQPDCAPGSVSWIYRIHGCAADPGDGYRTPGSFLASLGLLECSLGAVGNHLVHHHLSHHHGHGIFTGHHRKQILRPDALDPGGCPGAPQGLRRCSPCWAWVSPSCTNLHWAQPMASSNHARSGLNPACRSCSSFRQLQLAPP